MLLSELKSRKLKGSELKEGLKQRCNEIFHSLPTPRKGAQPKPFVISIVGINGVGKTTTIGKLAYRFLGEGQTVLLGATDTFRAGAIQQLKTWADKVGAQFVGGNEGGDPGAVAFDSVSAARSRNIDIVLLDTAGRLHTKTNLMEELKKIHRVIKKIVPDAPHETWLIVDSMIGQNSLVQVREFQSAIGISGVILTKMDGTSKGGTLLAIANEIKISVPFIGIGEGIGDLVPFEPAVFVRELLGEKEPTQGKLN